jgi:hypothetical protein
MKSSSKRGILVKISTTKHVYVHLSYLSKCRHVKVSLTVMISLRISCQFTQLIKKMDIWTGSMSSKRRESLILFKTEHLCVPHTKGHIFFLRSLQNFPQVLYLYFKTRKLTIHIADMYCTIYNTPIR